MDLLFIIFAVLTVLPALLMVVARNPVNGAMFMIVSFVGMAALFVLLEAFFLAILQVLVYAGAIMVLFLFVIMLLGAERVEHTNPSRFRWLTPVAIVLGLVFLITSSVAIIGGEIDLTEQQELAPTIRVVNAFDDFSAGSEGAVDVYLDGTLVAGDVAFGDNSSFETWDAGMYTATVFNAGEDAEAADPLVEQQIEVNNGEAISLVAIGRATGAPGPGLTVATHDVEFNDDKDTLWLGVVNALPEWDMVDLRDADSNDLLIETVAYGEAAIVEVEKGEYDLLLSQSGNARNELASVDDEDLEADDLTMFVFTDERVEGNAFEQRIIKLDAKAPSSFGSPTHVGRLLFSRYVLPFEMVSLLLLVAMIGAIVLTHEALGQRRRVVRRLANPPAGLEKPITGEPSK